MHWQATLTDGTVRKHLHEDAPDASGKVVHKPASSHHDLDPAKVKRFEVIEGGVVIWGMDGMPRNVRKRTAQSSNGRMMAAYVIVLPTGIVVAFDDSRVAKLANFLPEKHDAKGDGAAEGGQVLISPKGDVTINGQLFANGYPFYTSIGKHHANETDSHLKPD